MKTSLLTTTLCTLACTLALATTAWAQPSYSIDHQGPTALAPYLGGPGAVSDGDILTPVGPGTIAPPAVAIPAGATGLGLSTHPVWGNVEVDALSYGKEPQLDIAQPNGLALVHNWEFSVDEFAYGLPGVPGPSVTTEGAAPAGAKEAAADIYHSTLLAGPLAAVPGVNSGLVDGNGGATPFASPGLNLLEPNPPTFAGLPDNGDNLDAWDGDSPIGLSVYYSLDAAFLDPLEPNPLPAPNTGSAIAQASGPFVGGDVLVTTAVGGPPLLYAASTQLGLDGGVYAPGTVPNEVDDLDALVLWENGDGVYQPTTGPYSWLGGTTDMLLYSVRRGSAVIGLPDALGSGLRIEEGDILVPVFLGGSTWAPGIFVPGDNLGLATLRSGSLLFQTPYGDELDALDVRQSPIPEPGSLALLVLGTLCLGGFLRWRSKTRA